jgi:hypothetical protein
MSEAARFANGAVPVLFLTSETCVKPARRGLSQIRVGSRKVAEILDQIMQQNEESETMSGSH